MRAILTGFALILGFMSVTLPRFAHAEECGIPYLIVPAPNDGLGRYNFWAVLEDIDYPVNLNVLGQVETVLELGHPNTTGVGISRLYQTIHPALEFPRIYSTASVRINTAGQMAVNELVRVTLTSATAMELRRPRTGGELDLIMNVDTQRGTVTCRTEPHAAASLPANSNTLYQFDRSMLSVAARLQNERELEARAVSAETAATINATRADTFHRELTACVEIGANLESTVTRQERVIRNLVTDLTAVTKEKNYLGQVAATAPELIGDIKRLRDQVKDPTTRAYLTMLARKYTRRIRQLSEAAHE